MADLDTIERVRQIDVDKYKYGFETIDRSRRRRRAFRGSYRLHFGKEVGAAMDAWIGGSKPIGAGCRWTSRPGPRPLSKIDFNEIYYYSAPKGVGGS